MSPWRSRPSSLPAWRSFCSCGGALSVLVKISLCTVLLALVLYFAFVIYVVLLAGSAVQAHVPQPIPA